MLSGWTEEVYCVASAISTGPNYANADLLPVTHFNMGRYPRLCLFHVAYQRITTALMSLATSACLEAHQSECWQCRLIGKADQYAMGPFTVGACWKQP